MRSPLDGFISPFGRASGGGGVQFGALTKAGAGSYAVTGTSITSGDPMGHWQIVGGILSPSVAGDSANLNAGPYNLFLNDASTHTMVADADTYDVATIAQIQAAMNEISTAGGKTIKVRNTLSNAAETAVSAGGTTKIFTLPVVLTGYPGAIITPTLPINNYQNVTIQGLMFSDAVPQMVGVTDSIIRLLGAAIVTIQDNIISGAYRDPLGDYSAPGAYSNTYAAIWCESSGVTGYPDGITIRRNVIFNVNQIASLTCEGSGGVYVEDNECYNFYRDGFTFNIWGPALTAPIRCNRNVFYNFIGKPTDADNPHTDLLQFEADATNNGLSITDFQARQNFAWEDETTARGVDTQGIVCFTVIGLYNLIFQNPIITGNVFLLSGNHPISLSAINGGTFGNNTLMHPGTGATQTGAANLVIGPALGVTPYAVSGIVHVFNNISDGMQLDENNVGNALFTLNGNVIAGTKGATIPYSTIFDGPSFYPTSFAQAKAKFAMKAGGPADGTSPRDAGALGSGYGMFGSPRTPGGWSYDSAFEVVPPATVPDAFTAGQWTATTGNTSISVVISSLPDANGAYITDLDYRLNGGSWVSFGAIVPGTYNITGLTNDVSYAVEIRAENSIGSGPASDTKNRTPTNTFVGRSARFSATDNLQRSALSPAVIAGSEGMFSAWIYNSGAAWNSPVTQYITELRYGSTIGMGVYSAGTGRLAFSMIGLPSTPFTVPNSTFAVAGWYHVIYAWKTGASGWHQCYVNDVAAGTPASLTSATLTMAGQSMNRASLGRDNSAGEKWTGDLGHVYINLTESFDMSITANRRKFFTAAGDPVDLGATGNIPTGNNPAFYFDGVGAAFNNVSPASQALTMAGTLGTGGVPTF